MYKLYSQRQNTNQTCHPLEYDKIPQEFIQQYLYIAQDFFNASLKPIYGRHRYWEYLCKTYCRERGIPLIGEDSEEYAWELDLYMKHPDTRSDEILDIVELTFSTEIVPEPSIVVWAAVHHIPEEVAALGVNDFIDAKAKFIDELNQRFRQHNLGYELVNGQIIRKDSELLVQETIAPAFSLLHDKRFSSAEDEMQKAFRFRRDGENAEAILNAGKAFESTMAVICNELQYTIQGNKRSAGIYLTALRSNNFYPSYLNDHLTHICNTLEKGLPCVRNENGGHGAGTESTDISDAFADYALHLTATNIVFLVDLFNEKKLKHKGN